MKSNRSAICCIHAQGELDELHLQYMLSSNMQLLAAVVAMAKTADTIKHVQHSHMVSALCVTSVWKNTGEPRPTPICGYHRILHYGLDVLADFACSGTYVPCDLEPPPAILADHGRRGGRPTCTSNRSDGGKFCLMRCQRCSVMSRSAAEAAHLQAVLLQSPANPTALLLVSDDSTSSEDGHVMVPPGREAAGKLLALEAQDASPLFSFQAACGG